MSPLWSRTGPEHGAWPAARAQLSPAPPTQPPCQLASPPHWCQVPSVQGASSPLSHCPGGSGGCSLCGLGGGGAASPLVLCTRKDSRRQPSFPQRPVLGDETRLPTGLLTSPRCPGSLWASPHTGLPAGGGLSCAAPLRSKGRPTGGPQLEEEGTEQTRASWVVSGSVWRPGEPGLTSRRTKHQERGSVTSVPH